MPTPVVITAFNGLAPTGQNNFQGPFQNSVSKNIYAVLYNEGIASPDIEVWMSPDGVTWTEQNSGASPITVNFSVVAASYNDATKLITVLYYDLAVPAPQYDIQQFNTTTNLWGAPSKSPTYTDIAGDTFQGGEILIERSDGTFFVILTGADVLGNDWLNYVTWNGGVWSASPPTQISTAISNDVPYAAIPDASGLIFVFSTDANQPGQNNLYQRTINADGSITPAAINPANKIATNVVGAHNVDSDFFVTGLATFNSVASTLVVPYLTLSGEFHALVGTDVQTPIWTDTDLMSIYDPTGAFQTVSAISVGASNFVFRVMNPPKFSIEQDIVGGTQSIIYSGAGQPANISVGIVNGGISILFNLDPTGGMNPSETLYLALGGAPPHRSTPSQNLDQQKTAFVALPNPGKRCNLFGPERCVPVLRKRVLRGKVYTHVRAN